MHAILYHHYQIWAGLKSIFSSKNRLEQQNDVHNRLMRQYSEVPQWWYLVVFVASFILAAAALAKWLPEAPIWVCTILFLSDFSSLFLLQDFASSSLSLLALCHWHSDYPDCDFRARWWICSIWQSYSNEHVQSLWVYVFNECYSILARSQAWTLPQNPPKKHVSGSDHGNTCICYIGMSISNSQ